MTIPVSRHLALVVLLTGAVVSAAGAATSDTDPGPVVSSLSLPGGVAGLLRAADIPATPDPATAMLGFVRVVHASGPKVPELVIRYLDAVTQLESAASALPGQTVRLQPSGATAQPVLAWAAACGLAVSGGAVKDAPGTDAAARRQALEKSGLPVSEWARHLNSGETIRVEIRDEDVPLPLSPDLWMSAVLGRRVPREQLARAIFGNRRAALMYHGLLGLDDDTLGYLGGHPSLVTAIADRSPGVFAEWGRSVHITGGRVKLPGGEAASALWQEVVGKPPDHTDEFVRALVTRDDGRAAFFFDVVTHLDAARQAFALGLGAKGDRVERVRSLYGVFARTKTFDPSGDWPVIRHPFNPAAVLRQVMVEPSGAMVAPSSQELWSAAIGGGQGACAAVAGPGDPADAAWLVERIEREPLEARGDWVGAVVFAQRAFRRAAASELPAVCEAVSAFPRSDGLLLTLERTGLDRPADYSTVLGLAARAWAGADRRAAVIRTAQVQGVLAILERAVSSRSLSPAGARGLLVSLSGLASADTPLAPGAIGRWMRATLLPAVCRDGLPSDACLVRAVSGTGAPDGGSRVVSWEDERYRVDLGSGTAVRIERVLQAQRATGTGEALNLLAASATLADARAFAADFERVATILKALTPALDWDLATLFGHQVTPMRPALESALASLGSGKGAVDRSEAAVLLVEASDTLLADALVAFAYAMSIGDPDDAILLGGNPSRGHLFDATIGPATPVWHLPEEVQALDRSHLIEGSVFMLRTVYSRSWERRLSIQDPGARPRPDPQDVRAFGETAAIFNPFDLTDAGRDAIVAAIERGRARAARLTDDPAALWTAAQEAGLGEWRCRAALWASRAGTGVPTGDRSRGAAFFSLVELLRLGRPDVPPRQLDAWGVATRPIDGGLNTQVPRGGTWEDVQGPRGVGVLSSQFADVHLRVAEALAELKLPAVLAPDVAAYATWDVLTSAGMAHPDDWFALARAARSLPPDRFLDYVSALTAIGPLVPLR